ncbi:MULTISPECIES: hypothetical protein [unclassified Paenibacillus]|uniref:hypothetical protein n=1 Tax=unclassified Paenibacillus TaxID=185978 RepID=UPI002406C1C2|nr:MULTISPECIES: hypothetical protein [unclassified Paenibacillus]MDF9841502.1 hypothetical protein [Paenibacillus sp. PastF-2]MDF9848091.1 hypothetical protein [Paenibacillus sp. PastM-2]MDF9854660.1 hypothetical protein [Paenibacillus sp. PastF-1]MDH6479732.1 hypothetical protein [Paenibacillus sp. PastH-2]MDH6507366.1 hypothetical protein [Paenibacillus sp. PastM-3]
MERKYQEIREYTEYEIKEILDQQVIEELIFLPISVGLYHHSWKIAQNLCLELAQHKDAHVRANAVFGLAHIARTKGKLDKRIIKPIILKELRQNEEYRGMIIDAISDINQFLGWKLAKRYFNNENM